MRRSCWFIAAAFFAVSVSLFAATPKPDPRGVEFFEKKIRPIFAEHCYKCHSQQSEKVKGGLLLDTRGGLLKGGESGPAVVPGHPERSLLIKAVGYTDPDLQMPPKDKKLPDEKIEDLRTWIKMGAPDPRTNAVQSAKASSPSPDEHQIDFAAARKHWAFQPVHAPPVPKSFWSKNKSPIDAFVLEKLKQKGLKPSPAADKRTLVRRAYFDLIGLPPTPEEVEKFVADKSHDAYAKLIDHLLTSPHYGERWGRHWLDVARYADSKGIISTLENPRLPYAYTYRDWVIQSLNEDLPFDKFILQQLAADQLLQNTNQNRSLAALGFLTVGRRVFQNENETIDDRIDVVARGLLGLTVACARCHDHKYDPIPTRDYYGWHGIFQSSYEPTNLPLLNVPLPEQYTNYLAAISKARETLEAYTTSNELVVLQKLRSSVGDYLLAAHDVEAFATNSVKVEELLRARKLNNAIFQRWQTNLAGLKTNDVIFAPWFGFAKLNTNNFSRAATELCDRRVFYQPSQSGPTGKRRSSIKWNEINPLVAETFSGKAPTNLVEAADRYSKLFADISVLPRVSPAEGQGEKSTAIPPAGGTHGSTADEEKLREVLFATNSPVNPPRADFVRLFLFEESVKQKIEAFKRNIVEIESTHPGTPARAMALFDKPKVANTRIFIRGNPATRGAEAPRSFLEILCDGGCQPFPKSSSGRLELAQAIVGTNNPLTARVFVNRIWMHHFGAPLVDSPSDFGVRTEKPVEAELLDYLAARFMENGWSIKKLHRLIMLSGTYQQSSARDAHNAKIDPANKFFWRMNPRRLDFETMRDSLLAVSGQLDLSMGGQPTDILTNTAAPRRTVYAFIDRVNLPNLFRTFDFANPETSTPQRFETTVAPQALFLLNSPFVSSCVHSVASQAESSGDEMQRVQKLYKLLFQRAPTREETALAKKFFQEQPLSDAVIPEVTAWYYGSGIFDDGSQRTKNFAPLPYFNGTTWQGSAKLPDIKLGPLNLNATGGYPGRTNLAAIRRWIAPREGTINISGELIHPAKSGDGVRGRIVSSRAGLLGEWRVFNTNAVTSVSNLKVEKDEAIDFMVDGIANLGADTFKWAPSIEMARVENEELGLPHVWDAKQNFIDPKKLPKPLGAWEKYAQVLLLSNEFFFVE